MRLGLAVLVALLFGGLGAFLLARSHADAPARQGQSAAYLQPQAFGTAPYQYIAYSGSLDQTHRDTGIKDYFAAFVVSDGTCRPSWGGAATGGMDSPRAAQIATDFRTLRSDGGEVAVSFGGSNGTELASACQSAEALTGAYQQVVDTYSLRRVDFDIEGPTIKDAAATSRRAAAIAKLQKANPGLHVWITLPAQNNGLTNEGVQVLSALRDRGVILSGVNIMAMNYNLATRDMGAEAIRVSDAAHQQLVKLYPENSEADIWKASMITVMAGRNNTSPETFTLANASTVRKYAREKNVGTISLWNADRDKQCPDGTADPQPRVNCSGVAQQPYQFLKTLTR